MNRTYLALLCLFVSANFSSCEQEPTQTRHATTSNIVYLDQIVTRADEAAKIFQSMISKGNVLVDFYATWCPPCKMLGASIESVASRYPNVTFLKVDTDKFQDLARGIRSIPVVRLYKNGQQVYSKPGGMNANDLATLLRKHF